MMRFFYHYPDTHGTDGDMLDPGPLHEVAAAAERSGFDGFSLTEHPVPGARWLASGGHQSLDPLVALGYVAAATQRLRLLTHLVVAPYRNPFLLAKAAATVDRLSGGRLILGLGAGYQKSEFYALGVDMAERNALFDEALDVLPLHWSGQPFSYQDPSIGSPAAEPDRHREALAEMEKAGVTCVVISHPTHTRSATLEFLEAFGEIYLEHRGK